MTDTSMPPVMRFWRQHPTYTSGQVIEAFRDDPTIRPSLSPELLRQWKHRYGQDYGLNRVCRECGQSLPTAEGAESGR